MSTSASATSSTSSGRRRRPIWPGRRNRFKDLRMVTIASLWLPILLSAVVVFVASFVLHMLVPFHRSDYRTLPNEDQVMDTLRQLAIPPGDSRAPSAGSPSAMRDPKFLEKMTRGPVVVATFMPAGPI